MLKYIANQKNVDQLIQNLLTAVNLTNYVLDVAV